jgi:hypothetical protein
MWLGAAVSALAATRACLQWEPLVVPPMPGQPPTPPLPPMASVNLTTVRGVCVGGWGVGGGGSLCVFEPGVVQRVVCFLWGMLGRVSGSAWGRGVVGYTQTCLR